MKSRCRKRHRGRCLQNVDLGQRFRGTRETLDPLTVPLSPFPSLFGQGSDCCRSPGTRRSESGSTQNENDSGKNLDGKGLGNEAGGGFFDPSHVYGKNGGFSKYRQKKSDGPGLLLPRLQPGRQRSRRNKNRGKRRQTSAHEGLRRRGNRTRRSRKTQRYYYPC